VRGRETTGRRRPLDTPTAPSAVRWNTYPERAGRKKGKEGKGWKKRNKDKEGRSKEEQE
jgi:hypothetical protein